MARATSGTGRVRTSATDAAAAMEPMLDPAPAADNRDPVNELRLAEVRTGMTLAVWRQGRAGPRTKDGRHCASQVALSTITREVINP